MNLIMRVFAKTLLFLLAAVAPSALGASVPRHLPIITARFLVECPPQTRRDARSLPRNIMQQRVAVEQATVEVRCLDSSGRADGPAVRVRHSYRTSRAALARRAFFLARQLVWSGAYAGGKRHGPWQQYNRKGQQLGTVNFERGDATFQAWRSDGELACEGGIVDDKEIGKWRYWHGGGQLAMDGAFEEGRRHGRWRRYSRAGLLESDVSYARSKRHGLSTRWFPSGEKREEGHYRDGQRDGAWAFWNARGELLGINKLSKGSGRWMEWRDNGELRASGWLKAGRRHGHWQFFGPAGRMTEEGDYNNGIRARDTWKRYAQKEARSRRIIAALGSSRRGQVRGVFGRGGIALKGGVSVGQLVTGGAGRTGVGAGGLGLRGRGVGRIGGLSKVSNIGKRLRSGARIPEIRLDVKPSGGAQLGLPTAQRTRAVMLMRFCTITFDIKRLRKAATARQGHPPPLHDDATALLTLDSRGKPGLIRITRQAGQMDSAWHRCVTTAIKTLRFAGAGAGGATVELGIHVR